MDSIHFINQRKGKQPTWRSQSQTGMLAPDQKQDTRKLKKKKKKKNEVDSRTASDHNTIIQTGLNV